MTGGAPVCRQCGACCRWPGDVRLTDADIAALAAFLGLTEPDFIARHTRLARDRRALSLVETPGTTRCEFLEGDSRCLVYPARPEQCRGFLRTWRVAGCPALEGQEVSTRLARSARPTVSRRKTEKPSAPRDGNRKA